MAIPSPRRLAAALLVAFWSSSGEARGLPGTGILGSRQVPTGFQLAPQGALSGLGLASSCEQVLYQTIDCDRYVANFAQKVYRSSPGDKAFTDTVCAATCSAALATARRRVVGACSSTPDLFEGYPVLSLVDPIIDGWKETCFKDADGEYCNAKIDAFDQVEELADLPRNQLCSFCYVEKLRLMQSSPYSAYDSLHAERLSYINQNCEGTETPTDPQPPAITPNGTVVENCATGNKYTVKAGDTCNSIAREKSLSAATLYYINPNLLNCNEPAPGTEFCLPLTCQTTYTVQEGEDCVAIGVDQNTSWRDIISWNAGLDSRCSNVWSASDSPSYWGNVICVSAPGGVPDESPDSGGGGGVGNGNTGGPGGSGNGYADVVVKPPSTGTVAQGTTAACGLYVQARDGDTCPRLIVDHAVPISRFVKANTSLRNAERCSQYLRPGLWYCVLPVQGFDQTLG